MTAAGPSVAEASRLRRAGYGLAGAAAAATLFSLAPRTDALRFVAVTVPVVVVLLGIAGIGAVAARTLRPLLLAGCAGIALAASVLQLLQAGRSTNWLGGNGSTAALLAALGIGFGVLWYASRHQATEAEGRVDERA